MKTSILLVFTGGTIGSQAENGNIDLNPNAGFKLLQLFNQRFAAAEHISFKTLQPIQILSENLHPQHWQTIINAIEAEDLSQFDGIIMTHGTDTLAFSASALGLYFNQLTIPLLMVSSDLPLDNPQANGIPNLIAAVEFIRQIAEAGVFVAYQNPQQTLQIHQATRLAQCLPLSSDFISAQSKAYMNFTEQGFQRLSDKPAISPQPIKLKADFSARILLIKPYPGLNYDQFNLDQVDAVLHDLYHSGTACSSDAYGQQHDLVAFIKRCRQQNINIYLAPAIHSDSAYSSTRELLAHGGEMIWNLSLEAAYAKLLLAYSNFNSSQAISEFLAGDVAGEHIG
jgi:L-asparaginase